MQHWEGTLEGHAGTALYLQRWSMDEPPRAVLGLVHGYGEHSSRYGTVVDYLVPRGYEIWGFDHRGYGRSPGRRGHIESWSEFRGDVRAFVRHMEQERPDRPLFLFGHSLGGLITLEYALHYPEGLRGVVASAPAVGEIGINPVLFQLSRVVSRVWPTYSRDIAPNGHGLSRDPAVGDAMQADPLAHSRASARFGWEMALAIKRTQAAAPRFAIPLLIIHGTEDRIVRPEASKRFFERVTLADKERYELVGGYHEPHNDIDRDRTMGIVARWLERHVPEERTESARLR